MTPFESIVANLVLEIDKLVDEKVDAKLEHKLPELIRTIGIGDADRFQHEDLIDAGEVAKRLGFDVSTENALLLSKQRVYTLARRKLIPSIRLSPRRIRFSPAAIERLINDGGFATAFTEAA